MSMIITEKKSKIHIFQSRWNVSILFLIIAFVYLQKKYCGGYENDLGILSFKSS